MLGMLHNMPPRSRYYMRKVLIFRNHHPLLGPVLWLLSIQYFVTQLVVAAAWTTSFSLRRNAISDLGNTACGQYADRLVCSPLHNWMNASFIVLGVTIVLGSFLIPDEFRSKVSSRIGFYCMGLAGLGTILVGVFPENTVSALHFIGAVLPFFLGNLALVFFSYSLPLPPLFCYYTRFSGILALIAFGLFMLDHYLGLGFGGMERLTAYPQTIWLIAFGWYISLDHYRQQRGQRVTYS
jgi:hypothetical membrane protein